MGRMQLKRPVSRRSVVRTILTGIGLAIVALLNQWMESDKSGPAAPIPAEGVTGVPRLVDGDSFHMNGDEVRMKGIDAPEGRQTCQRQGRDWPCGEEARRELQRQINGMKVTCEVHERDQHRRLLGTCRAGGKNLNAAMVEQGYAVAFGGYEAEERVARNAKRGLWSGEFERPRDWRLKNGIGQ